MNNSSTTVNGDHSYWRNHQSLFLQTVAVSGPTSIIDRELANNHRSPHPRKHPAVLHVVSSADSLLKLKFLRRFSSAVLQHVDRGVNRYAIMLQRNCR